MGWQCVAPLLNLQMDAMFTGQTRQTPGSYKAAHDRWDHHAYLAVDRHQRAVADHVGLALGVCSAACHHLLPNLHVQGRDRQTALRS